jgi:hypothetical protein
MLSLKDCIYKEKFLFTKVNEVFGVADQAVEQKTQDIR